MNVIFISSKLLELKLKLLEAGHVNRSSMYNKHEYTLTSTQSLFYKLDLQRDTSINKTHTRILVQTLLPKIILITIKLLFYRQLQIPSNLRYHGF